MIPIEIAQNNQENQIKMVWLTEKSYKSWFKINKGMKGYYVTNYNDAGWTALIQLLKDNHKVLDCTDRAGLIHDSYKLAWYCIIY
ncbi:hypothetical protein MXB_2990 [Myxobolus squamalis]|nr:hypothetical protein MXB_2990 [Myxobolus squamalis]